MGSSKQVESCDSNVLSQRSCLMIDDKKRNLPAPIIAPVHRPSGQHLPAQVKPFGDLLVRERCVSLDQMNHAIDLSQRTGRHVYSTLAELHILNPLALRDFMLNHHRVPVLELANMDVPDKDVLDLIPKEMCVKHLFVPVSLDSNRRLTIVMVDPGNYDAIKDAGFKSGCKIDPAVATQDEILHAIELFYTEEIPFPEFKEDSDTAEVTSTDEDDTDDQTPQNDEEENKIVAFVKKVLIDAVKRRASDIHFESYDKEFRIRYRIDGVLIEMIKTTSLKLRNPVVNRIKIMCRLDISERRRPQDGRMKLKMADGKECHFRVSVVPTLFGEKVVARLLDKSNLQTDMTQLGFDDEELRQFKYAVHQSNGLVLVTGPTGSGKTTTLYSALTELNKTTDNISTVEDPIEFDLRGINQLQVNDEVGLNFAQALRSFLRQDPDVIMLGEIRDFETAEMAIKASQTGHLVLSTLHTNNAPSTIGRLLNMGVESFLLADSLNLIAAQRLVRTVCTNCKKPHVILKEDALAAGMTEAEFARATFMKGTGCKLCNETGMKGRLAVYEIMVMTDPIREAMIQGSSTAELKSLAVANGMQTLRRSALKKLAEGKTSLEEVLRVTRAD